METPRESVDAPNARGIASLVLGILGFFAIPCVGSVLAIVLGWGERSQVGRAGLLLGWVGLAFSMGALLLALLLGGVGLLIGAWNV